MNEQRKTRTLMRGDILERYSNTDSMQAITMHTR